MSALLLARGHLIDPSQNIDGLTDLLIVDGKVAALGPDAAARAPSHVNHIDLHGKKFCPGLIDMHVHLREPGQGSKETIATGTAAAARGGFTTVLCMPNTSPTIDNPGTVALLHEKARADARVNVLVAGAITKGIAGEELAPIGSLHKAGIVAITDDGHCIQSNEMMRRALEYSTMFDLLVLDHCQDYSMVTDGVMHEGRYSIILGLRGWPSAAEEMIVARNIMLAQRTGARLHCQHLSAAGSVQLIRHAKAQGIPISGEACPHHFTLTEAALAGSDEFWKTDGANLLDTPDPQQLPQWPAYDTSLKMNPPVRSATDRDAILNGLADGTLEVIGSDHAPHCNYEKEVEFDYAPFGITGLETEFALSLMALYHSKRMPLSDLIARFTTGPARLLKLHTKGTLAPGADADVTVFDPNARWTFSTDSSLSKSRNSPFHNWPLRGKATLTLVAGKVVWEDLPGPTPQSP